MIYFLQEVPILSILIITPLIGIFFIIQISSADKKNLSNSALWVTIFNLILSTPLIFGLADSSLVVQFYEKYKWLPSYDLNLVLGVDSISIVFILLTTFLTPIALVILKETVHVNFRFQVIMLLFLESCLIGTFSSIDMMFIYIFSETSLFLFLFFANYEKINDKLIKFFSVIAVTSICLLVTFLKLSQEVNAPVVETFQYSGKCTVMDNKFGGIIIPFVLLRLGTIPFLEFYKNIYKYFSLYPAYLFSIFLTFITLYYACRFFPIILPNIHPIFSKIIYIAALIITIQSLISIIYYSRQKQFKMLIPNTAQILSCTILLALPILGVNGVQGIIFTVLSYAITLSGLFIVTIVLNNINIKHRTTYFIVASALLLFHIGLPGSFGFWGKMKIFLGLLENNALEIALCFLLLHAFLIIYVIKIYTATLCQKLLDDTFYLERKSANTCYKSTVLALYFLLALSLALNVVVFIIK